MQVKQKFGQMSVGFVFVVSNFGYIKTTTRAASAPCSHCGRLLDWIGGKLHLRLFPLHPRLMQGTEISDAS